MLPSKNTKKVKTREEAIETSTTHPSYLPTLEGLLEVNRVSLSPRSLLLLSSAPLWALVTTPSFF